MKVCSLYGAGFYYMPGTDICLKLGGYVRFQPYVGAGMDLTRGPMASGAGWSNRATFSEFGIRSRAIVSVDTRQQTAYGTLRTYLVVGANHDTSGAAFATATATSGIGNNIYANRAFIQIAGFTLGKATSFFDIYPNATFGYLGGMVFVGDTGEGGQIVAAYTALFGNGVSGTIAVENSRRRSTVNVTANPFALGAAGPTTTGSNIGSPGATNMPDFVANIRIDQSWGSWLIAGALHDVSGTYYSGAAVGSAPVEGNGAPGDKWGWAVTGGFIWNLPMIAPGDRLSAQVTYSQGAGTYASQNPVSWHARTGTTVGAGFATDAVYQTGSAVELTTVWGVAAAFEHLWTPAFRTSWYGSYISYDYNANASAMICTTSNTGGIVAGTSGTGCNPDWSAYSIGSRTQWEPVKAFIIGLDVVYMKLNSMRTSSGTIASGAVAGSLPAVTTWTVADQDRWVGTIRVQRDFLP